MKFNTKMTDSKRIFALCTGVISICVILGFIISLKATSIFSEGLTAIRNASFQETGFLKTLSKAIRVHFWYSICVLLLAPGFPGVILPGAYIAFKSFFLGVTVGLAAKTCSVAKTVIICFAVFASNVFILPLYILMFFVSLSFCFRTYSGTAFFANTTKNYFSFAAKVFVVFALMCIVECIQTFLGTAILKTTTM